MKIIEYTVFDIADKAAGPCILIALIAFLKVVYTTLRENRRRIRVIENFFG